MSGKEAFSPTNNSSGFSGWRSIAWIGLQEIGERQFSISSKWCVHAPGGCGSDMRQAMGKAFMIEPGSHMEPKVDTHHDSSTGTQQREGRPCDG